MEAYSANLERLYSSLRDRGDGEKLIIKRSSKDGS